MSDPPDGWEHANLEDLTATEERAVTDGPFGSNLKTAHYTEDGPRVIRLQNIGDGEFIDERAHISEEHFETLRAHEARAGDLIVASLGADLPRACIVPEALGPAIVKADCIRVRLHPDVNTRYVNYALQRPDLRHAIADQIHGVGRPRLGMKGIRAIEVPVPPRAEQERIVEAIEEQLESIESANRWLESGKKRHETLVRSIITEAASTLDPPNHWATITVGDAGRCALGLQRSPKRHRGPNMRPYLRVANVFEDRIDASDVMEMDMSDEEWERFRLYDGDVLLNEGQSPHLLGRPAIYRGDPPDVAFTNSLIRFQATDGVDPEWALLVFRSHMHNRRFMKESQITTNIAHLSLGRLKSVEFPVPPLDEQRACVLGSRSKLEAADRLHTELETASRRASQLRRSVLSAAFSGQLVSQNRSDEPAAELLGRIRAEKPAKKSRSQKRVSS